MTALTDSFIAAREAFERNTREIKEGMHSLDVAMSLLQTKSADAAGIHEAALHHLTEARRAIGFGHSALETWYTEQTIKAQPGGGGEIPPIPPVD